MKYTVTDIKLKLLTDDRWLYRGLLAIYDRQTDKEKQQGDTIEDNGEGFSGPDGKLLSRFAQDLKKYGDLLPKKKVIVRGRMLKYASQLCKIANQGGKSCQQN